MAHWLIAEPAYIFVKPTGEALPDLITQLTLGDLHSNAIKLCYFLTRHNIIEISRPDYLRLVKLYQTPPTPHTIEEFTTIVKSFQIKNRKVLLRFLGDELADRGQNDLYILILLEKLYQEKVPVEILLSNHGIEFIESYEQGFKFRDTRFDYYLARSFYNLQTTMKLNLVSHEKINTIIQNVYQNILTIISYSLNEDKNCITLYSHAPIDLNVIELLAKKFNVIYKDKSAIELAETIKAIQDKFSEFTQTKKIHTLYNKAYFATLDPRDTPNDSNLIDFVTWNRNYACLIRPPIHNGYNVCYVHGHDPDEPSRGCIYNLDNQLGKPGYERNTYTLIISDELRTPSTGFNFYLRQLRQKSLQHRANTQLAAARATQDCYTMLEKHSQNFFSGNISSKAFRENCNRTLMEVRDELKKHRGWKKIFANSKIVAKSQLNNLAFFQTDSIKLINSLQIYIENLPYDNY